ncbi:MAG: hypothetical protein J0H52_17640, partial [Comamonadaceae bacterium]|nr:hypothetical protein [Comamonadaceae bacterium]
HLIASILGGYAGLEKTRADCVERGEGFAVAEQGAAPLDFAPCRNDVINALQLLVVQAHGHAQLSQIAIGTGNFDGGLKIHVGKGRFLARGVIVSA